MTLYEIAGDGLRPVAQKTFTDLGMLERANIQRAVCTHIAAITPGVKTMVLAEEFGDWVAQTDASICCASTSRHSLWWSN